MYDLMIISAGVALYILSIQFFKRTCRVYLAAAKGLVLSLLTFASQCLFGLPTEWVAVRGLN